MASCERCWADSQRDPYAKEGEYGRLVARRNGVDERECTPEEQAGPDAETCQRCGRKTMHQICKDTCMVPSCQAAERARIERVLDGLNTDLLRQEAEEA